jgi:hypothetical protein
MDTDKFQTPVELLTKQGELIIKNFALPNNLKTSEYVLEISDITNIDP